MLRRIAAMAWLVAWIAPFSPAAGAEPPGGGTVQGMGEVTVKVQPTVLRMEMTLHYQDKTLEGALKGLKERRAEVTAKLQELMAENNSIRWTGPKSVKIEQPPTAGTGPSLDPYSGRTPVPPPGIVAPPFSPPPAPTLRIPGGETAAPAWGAYAVSTTFSADWPLEAEGAEGLLIAAQKLQEKILAADLLGSKPNEKGRGDRGAAQVVGPTAVEPYTPPPLPNDYPAASFYTPSAGAPSGAPRFVYVARISVQQRKAALAEACAEAKIQAAELAEAAGAKLGAVASLKHNIVGITPGSGYGPQVFERCGIAVLNDDEGIGLLPGEIRLRIQVQAQFELQ
jgi:uncharacterized protein YggE